MLKIYRVLRLCLPTYYGYPVLIVLCASGCVLCLCELWVPVVCVLSALCLFGLLCAACKIIQRVAERRLATLPGNKENDVGNSLRFPLSEAKVKFRTAEGNVGVVNTADQYEAAMIAFSELKANPGTRYSIMRKNASRFGRGFRYDWLYVCGNLPSI